MTFQFLLMIRLTFLYKEIIVYPLKILQKLSYLKDIYSHYLKRLYLTKNKNIYIKLIQFFEKIDSIL